MYLTQERTNTAVCDPSFILASSYQTLTGCHVDEHALSRADVTEVVQHHVGGEVVDGYRGRLLEAHPVRHREDVLPGHGHVLAPHPEVIDHYHPVSNL